MAAALCRSFLILIEIKAPVADIQAQGVPRGVIHAAFRRHIDHVALKFVRQLPVGSLNVQELAELSGERLCFFQQPGALFIVLFPAKGGVSELLRKPGDFGCSKLSVCSVLALSEP